MKKLHLIALYALAMTFMTQTMKLSWEQTIKNTFKEVFYPITTRCIDIAYNVGTTIQRPIQAIQQNKFIKLNQLKFKKIEKNLREKEQHRINALLQESGMNNEQINQTLDVLQMAKKAHKEYLSQPDIANITHDPELSEQTAIIKEQLAKKGFNSNNVNIIQEKLDKKSIRAENRQFLELTGDGVLPRSKIIINPKVLINPDTIAFNKLNSTHKKATVIHETEHSIEEHMTTQAVINGFIKHFTNNSDIATSPKHHDLVQIHEAQAERFPSLRDSETASIMRKHRHNAYYPNMLYGKHYEQLVDIDETHKMIAYLKAAKKRQENFESMPQIKPSKFLMNLNHNNA